MKGVESESRLGLVVVVEGESVLSLPLSCARPSLGERTVPSEHPWFIVKEESFPFFFSKGKDMGTATAEWRERCNRNGCVFWVARAHARAYHHLPGNGSFATTTSRCSWPSLTRQAHSELYLLSCERPRVVEIGLPARGPTRADESHHLSPKTEA